MTDSSLATKHSALAAAFDIFRGKSARAESRPRLGEGIAAAAHSIAETAASILQLLVGSPFVPREGKSCRELLAQERNAAVPRVAHLRLRAILASAARCAALTVLAVTLWAAVGVGQTATTGQISGFVTDESGAVVPGAEIELRSVTQNTARTTKTNNAGLYLFPLVDPGTYQIRVRKPGFKQVDLLSLIINVQDHIEENVSLKVGSVTESVTVDMTAPLIQPGNPNTTTTLTTTQLAEIPNPGNDLSYLAALAPGAVLNTNFAGGFANGNVEVNGLGSVSTDSSIDGLDANDPYNNFNSTGASGLQLGLNAIQEVSINTESYGVDLGRLGAAQINYLTKSGSNSFHGNAYETWNGSRMNANNFFLNALGQPKPRSNVNEFGASVGGPIVKNKLFFFADLEGVRLVLPTILTSTLPTPAYQAYVLQQLPVGGTDSVIGNPLPPQPAEVPLYQAMFKQMGDTSRGNPLAILGCPLNADGTQAGGSPPDGAGCANVRNFSVSPHANETLFTIKLDYDPSARDTFWFRFQLNNGQREQADPVSSIFNTVTPVPIRSGAAGWTHTFTPTLVNQFNPGISYVSNNPRLADPSLAATIPITYNVLPFSQIGGQQSSLPLGVATTTWQINDNLSWNVGRHALKFGENLRRLLFSSFTGAEVIPLEIGCSLPEFTYGAACLSFQAFPTRVGDRLAQVGLDTYAMDTIRVTQRLTVTAGLRVSWNSDLVSQHNLFSRLNPFFNALSHDADRPLNQDVLANQGHLYASTPLLQWTPRVAVGYQLRPRTVLRTGFGLFADPYEGNLERTLALNSPNYNFFNAGIFGPLGGVAIAPGVPNSVVDAAIAADKQFRMGFANGTQSCASTMASPTNCLPATDFSELTPNRKGQQEYPYILQWSAALEHQFAPNLAIAVKYVGTRAVKMLFTSDANGFETVCQGCFAPLPFGSPPDARFGRVTAYQAGANSSYHGLQITGQKRLSHGLSFQFNYAYSHCLDTTSNGGITGFNLNASNGGPLAGVRRFYGNCDYDVRHSLNGSYTYELPFHSKQRLLNGAIAGWQVSGTIFIRGGFPISVLSALPPGGFQNVRGFSPRLFANSVPGVNPYSRNQISGVTQPGTIQWLNPEAFQSVWDTSTNSCFPTTDVQNCQDGNLGRNAFRAPGFKWTDLDIGKRFKISERVDFRFDAQFYNLFNHPNFGFPGSFGNVTAGIPGQLSTLTNFGTISTTVSPTTGLLGAGLGGDSSVRMIALRGTVTF